MAAGVSDSIISWTGCGANPSDHRKVSYELCVLVALRDALRSGEVWVVGSRQWRNLETHLPADFDLHRDVHYEAIAQPVGPTAFVASVRERLERSLAGLSEALRTGTAGTSIGTRRNQVWITVSKQPKQVVPPYLDALKDEVTRRWVSCRCWTCSRTPTG